MSLSFIRFPARVPEMFRSARHSKSCPAPRGDEAPPPHPSPDGASLQAGTAATKASDASPRSSAARAAVPATLFRRPGRGFEAELRGLLLLAASVLDPAPAPAQSMEDRARAAAQASRAKASESDTLLRNYVTPGLAGQPIATVDGTKTFAPRLACQKTATLLELLVQPAATGDITTLRVARDSNFDGTLDQTITLPVPVSGICANGIISCQPGTWSQCRSFRWTAQNAAISLAEVPMDELAGCYCINASCGTNLVWANMAEALKDLGGGLVGALTTADPRIGIAQASIDGPVIRYTGAQTTACSADPALPASAYRANPASISADATAASQSSSLFQTLAGSPAGGGQTNARHSCSITREIALAPTTYDDIVSVTGSLISVTACGDGCRRYRIGGDGNCSASPPAFTARFEVLKPERLVSARIVRLAANDWLQARVEGAAVGYAGIRPWLGDELPPGDCSVDAEPTSPDPIDLTQRLRAGSAAVTARVRGGQAQKWGYIDLEVRVDTSCQASERLVDLCAGIAGDAKCRLFGETVDGVETVRGGVMTGLRPLPLTRLIGTGGCTMRLTRDFFEKSRSYLCSAGNPGLPPPDLSRGAYIIDHSTETMLADRVRTADGGAATSTRAFALPARGAAAVCEPICKTRAAAPNVGAAPDGVVAAKQNDPSGWDTFYHACDARNVCPAGPGEEIVAACGCLDDFPEAVVMMQTVRLGGSDLVCTGAER